MIFTRLNGRLLVNVSAHGLSTFPGNSLPDESNLVLQVGEELEEHQNRRRHCLPKISARVDIHYSEDPASLTTGRIPHPRLGARQPLQWLMLASSTRAMVVVRGQESRTGSMRWPRFPTGTELSRLPFPCQRIH